MKRVKNILKPNLLHHLTLCVVGLALCSKINAQSTLIIKDSETKLPLPGAHAHWLDQNNAVIQTFISDQDGIIELKILNQPQEIKIKFLGYETKVETILPTDKKVELFLTPQAYRLDEAVITGQYGESNTSNAVQPITIINREKIELMGAVTLNDVLANELNIRLNQDNILGTFMTMQGISGQNVKILIDGVPVIGRLDGNIDLSQINLQNIERIEVIKGPMSVNYGTDALAGTINLITKNGKHYKNQVNIGTYAESLGRLNAYTDVHWHSQNHIVQFSAGRNLFNGWNPNDPFFTNLRIPIADSSRFKQWKPRIQNFADAAYTYKKTNFNIRLNSRIFDETIINRGTPRPPYFETAFDEYYLTRRLDNNLVLNKRFQTHKNLQVIAAYNYFSRTRQTYFKDLTTLDQSLSELEGSQDTSVFDLINIRTTFAQSNPNKKLNYEIGSDINYETTFGMRIQGAEQEIGDFALFTSVEYKPVTSVKIRPGIRYAYNTRFNSPLVPALNVLWNLNENWALRGSYVRGFRAPTLKELYFFFVDINHNIVGNPDLNAEYSHNARFGIHLKKGLKKSGLKIGLNGFYNDIRNMITLAQIDAVQFSYVNIGKFRSIGGELEATYLLPSWKITTGMTYTGRDQGWDEYMFYPEFQLNISKTFQKQNITLSAFYKYTGRLPGFALVDNEIVNTFINPYSMTDITASKKLFEERLVVTLGCKNLLNVTQIDAFEGSGGAHTSGGSSVAIGMGRTLFLKLDWNINYKKKNETVSDK